MKYPRIDFGKVTSEQISAYADASHDFNPIHLDPEFAKKAGLPSVIAHGMLSMGLASRALSDWGFSLSELKHFESKFKDKVFVNEELFAELISEERTGEGLKISWKICKKPEAEVLIAEALFA